MRKLYIPVLVLIILAFSGCVITTTDASSAGSNGSSDILKYSNYKGVAYSAAKSVFSPTKDAVVEVYCQNTDFALRRALEEAVASAFAQEGIRCVMFSDYSVGLMLSDLTDEERDDIGWKEFRDKVEYYINISMGECSTYTYGGGIAKGEFDFNIMTSEKMLTGSLYIEETSGNQIQRSYMDSLKRVLPLVGDLVVKEYLKYCPEIVEEQDIEQ